MSLSWRIQTTFDDRSQRAIASSATGTGATVVAGSRSVEEPILFARGETQRMLNLFGTPTRQDQGLLEAIEFNKSYPLYCVSPAKVKKFNYIQFVGSENNVTSVVATDYMTEQSVDTAGIFNCGADFTISGATRTVTINTANISGGIEAVTIYANLSTGRKLLETTVDSTSVKGDVAGTVSLDDEAGTATITLSTITGYEDVTLSVNYPRTMGTDIYLILVQRGSGNFLRGNIQKVVLRKGATEEDNTYYLTFNYEVLNYLNNYQDGSGSPVSFALEKGAVDGFQRALNAETRFANNDYFKAIYNPNASGKTDEYIYGFDEEGEPTTNIEDIVTFTLNNVSREYSEADGPLADTDIKGGYAFFHKVNSYQPDLFFDATGNSEAVKELEDIRDNYHQYARVLVPLYTSDPTSTAEAIENISSIPANRGFSAYWGEFEISNSYSTEYPVFQGVPMGDIAKRHSDAISLSYGGLAVAWIDENGVGGQLSGTRLIRGLADPSEEELKSLDENRINPVIYDDTYGPMILSRRTTYTDYSDYSFNDYSGIIDYCVKNIIKNALPYQIVKMNDATHRATVRNRIDNILRPLTVAPYNVLRAYAIKCDSENNTDEVMANEEFVVEVGIQIQSKARTIKLTFINTAQTTTVEEALA